MGYAFRINIDYAYSAIVSRFNPYLKHWLQKCDLEFSFFHDIPLSFSNGEHLPVGVPTNSSPINGEGRGCDISPRTASLDRLNFMSNEDHSRSEVNHRSPLKPTGKEAELAAALKKSRRRSGSSPGNAGTV